MKSLLLFFVRLVLAALSHALFAAPALADESKDEFLRQANEMRTGPANAPRLNETSFAATLRCMDGMFRNYGAQGVSVVVEEIPDATKKVPVGARDMFMSATSQMTRSSRAIRLIPFQAQSVLFDGRRDVLQSASYAVQGSISQFDESMLQKQRDGAICLGPLCIGAATSDTFSGMALDLNVIETEGLTLLPGVTAKNSVLIRRKGKGYDGDINYKKFGVQYNFSFTSSDGQGQALRSLMELAAIELYGRLLKIPYWSCLGANDQDPQVKLEIDDWWETLRADLPSLVAYFQVQMRTRGLYRGKVNGELDEDLKRALRSYQVALGFADDLKLNRDFFARYLAADHSAIAPVAQAKLSEIVQLEGPAPAASIAPVVQAAAAPATSNAISIEGSKGGAYIYRRGEPLQVDVTVQRDGYLYCYLIDETRQVTQFFPNPAQASSNVARGTRLQFPGRFPFKLFASPNGVDETVACFAATNDLGAQPLPRDLKAQDVEMLKTVFSRNAGVTVEMGVFDVKVQ